MTVERRTLHPEQRSSNWELLNHQRRLLSEQWADDYALNVLINPQVFFDGEKGMEELPDLERKALIDTIKKSIQEVIEED